MLTVIIMKSLLTMKLFFDSNCSFILLFSKSSGKRFGIIIDIDVTFKMNKFLMSELTLSEVLRMMTSSNGKFSVLLVICAGNSPVNGEFPSQRPVTRSFDVFFDLRLNKRLSKQSRDWWFETPSCSLWRHCNGLGWFHNYCLCCIGVATHILFSVWLELILQHFGVFNS